MKISTLFYTIKQGFANIFRNKWYSLASIATISACLFLFGLFYCIVSNFQNILKTAEEGVSVTVFFHSDMDNCESHVDRSRPNSAWKRSDRRLPSVQRYPRYSSSLQMMHGQPSDRIISVRIMQKDSPRIHWQERILMRFS